jgi:hypothetical protein
MSAGLASAAGVLAAVPVVGAIVAPARREAHVWRAVGAVDDFPPGETRMVPVVDPGVRDPVLRPAVVLTMAVPATAS